jgi:hypothetical protein
MADIPGILSNQHWQIYPASIKIRTVQRKTLFNSLKFLPQPLETTKSHTSINKKGKNKNAVRPM